MVQPLTIVIPIYPGVTQLDFTGPHQFFSRVPDVRVIVASQDARPVEADGMVFTGLADLMTITGCDILCVPGGNGCFMAMENVAFLRRLHELGQRARFIGSVCTGSLLLAAAGLLKGKRAACHWAWRDLLPAFGVIADTGRVVRDGNIITGGGVTAGMDFALAIIAEAYGQSLAERIQLGLEYAPEPPFQAGRPETAPAPVRDAEIARLRAYRPARQAAVEAAAARLRSR
ncbi:DJ-1/PfpI family protein [Martelella alba]|uniref:DJ-1/PfpI family protein n=1 Tax=Martelella alba TaxID=2590451 RepID=A0ABY2SRB9_9HYPH|nr:DJ-1/PfpI family protein [Martelella alba]TKI07420.1 DJ-1/PfpI family protein [Martelella alba]